MCLFTVQPNPDVDVEECFLSQKKHRLCEYTLISFKCQSIRSKVHCTNKTLHNESQNVTVQLGPRVTCAKNMTRYTDIENGELKCDTTS